jgi:hypothetical protein
MQWENIQDNYFISNTGVIRRGTKILNGYTRPDGYKTIRIGGQNCYFHRLVALCFIPNPNNFTEVDHIDLNPSNNNVENLRWADRSIQSKNRKTHTTTGKKYIVMIKNNFYDFDYRLNGIRYTKLFKTLEEAVQYRNNFFIEHNIAFDAAKYDRQ